MRTKKIYLTFLAAFVTISLVAQERTNLITNGNFESTVDVSGHLQASDWTYVVGDAVSSDESNVASDGGLNGSKSLRIRDGIDNSNEIYQDLNLTPNRYYAASCLMAFSKDGFTNLKTRSGNLKIITKGDSLLQRLEVEQDEATAIEGDLTAANLHSIEPFLVEVDSIRVEISVAKPSYPLRADEVKVWMLNNEADVLSTEVGQLNTDGSIVTLLVPGGTLVEDILSNITVSDSATTQVLVASGGDEVANSSAVATGNILLVTSEDSTTQKEYGIEVESSTYISKNIESQLIITNSYIQFPETQSQLRLYDLSGRIVKEARNTSVLNIEACKSGIYVISGNGVRKLIYKK